MIVARTESQLTRFIVQRRPWYWFWSTWYIGYDEAEARAVLLGFDPNGQVVFR